MGDGSSGIRFGGRVSALVSHEDALRHVIRNRDKGDKCVPYSEIFSGDRLLCLNVTRGLDDDDDTCEEGGLDELRLVCSLLRHAIESISDMIPESACNFVAVWVDGVDPHICVRLPIVDAGYKTDKRKTKNAFPDSFIAILNAVLMTRNYTATIDTSDLFMRKYMRSSSRYCVHKYEHGKVVCVRGRDYVRAGRFMPRGGGCDEVDVLIDTMVGKDIYCVSSKTTDVSHMARNTDGPVCVSDKHLPRSFCPAFIDVVACSAYCRLT